MIETDLCYAAGFIDADGSILIERSKDKRVSHGVRHVPRICAVGIDRAPLEFLQTIFGGNICEQRHRVDSKSKKRVFQWSICNQRAMNVARLLLPHLRVKALPAYLLSCFEYEASWTKGGRPEDARMPRDEFERRESLTQEMRAANDRGQKIQPTVSCT